MVLPRARTLSIEIVQAGDGLVLYDLLRNRVHELNRSAALVWRHCDGVTTLSDVAELLSTQLGVPAAEGAAAGAVRRLEKAGLLAEPAGPAAVGAITRRDLLRSLSRAGLAACLAPVVASVLITEPAQAGIETDCTAHVPPCPQAGCNLPATCATIGRTCGCVDYGFPYPPS